MPSPTKLKECVYLETYAVAPSPSRDYYYLKITDDWVWLYVWKITRRHSAYPITRKQSLADYIKDIDLQNELIRIFGVEVVSRSVAIARGDKENDFPTQVGQKQPNQEAVVETHAPAMNEVKPVKTSVSTPQARPQKEFVEIREIKPVKPRSLKPHAVNKKDLVERREVKPGKTSGSTPQAGTQKEFVEIKPVKPRAPTPHTVTKKEFVERREVKPGKTSGSTPHAVTKKEFVESREVKPVKPRAPTPHAVNKKEFVESREVKPVKPRAPTPHAVTKNKCVERVHAGVPVNNEQKKKNVNLGVTKIQSNQVLNQKKIKNKNVVKEPTVKDATSHSSKAEIDCAATDSTSEQDAATAVETGINKLIRCNALLLQSNKLATSEKKCN